MNAEFLLSVGFTMLPDETDEQFKKRVKMELISNYGRFRLRELGITHFYNLFDSSDGITETGKLILKEVKHKIDLHLAIVESVDYHCCIENEAGTTRWHDYNQGLR